MTTIYYVAMEIYEVQYKMLYNAGKLKWECQCLKVRELQFHTFFVAVLHVARNPNFDMVNLNFKGILSICI